MFSLRRAITLVSLSFALVAVSPSVMAETTLTAITSIPRGNKHNEPFKFFMEALEKRAKGVVSIRYLGGPDAIPVQEQVKALDRGVVDLVYGPMSYYQGQMPEVQAFNGSNLHAAELRTNGGLAAVNKIANTQINAEILGYYGSGVTFYVYTKAKPKLGPDGTPDLSGMRIRGTSIYRPFLEKFGATVITIHFGEIYSALERGVVDGIGFVGAGLTDGNWEKFLKYRITPAYWQSDVAIVVNKAKWDGLTSEAKDALTKAATEAEALAHNFYVAWSNDEEEKLKRLGMEDVALSGEAAKIYRAAAYDLGVWNTLKENTSAERANALRSLFYRP